MRQYVLLIFSLIAGSAFAQENCGFPVSQLRTGFEPDEVSDFAQLPPNSTPLSLSITYPQEGETLSNPEFQIYGDLTGPANIGVTANNVPILTSATKFTSRAIRLDPGPRAISLVLRTMDGQSVTVVRNVIVPAANSAEVSFRAETTGTYPPQNIRFALSTQFPPQQTSVARVQLDFDGNGTFESDAATAPSLISYRYRIPGAFLARAVVSFDDGDPMTALVVRESTYRVQVQSLPYARETLCTVYYAMKNRLIAGQIPLALNTLRPRIRTDLQTIWNQLGPNLAATASGFGQIVTGQISDSSAELIMAVPDPAVPGEFLGFPVLFSRGQDGVWRIYAL
jgi:hypothetical protein